MLLLIPGPVATAPAVKAALAHDFAPWDNDFRAFVAQLRARVLAIAGGIEGEHIALPLQGCGHFITEAAIRTFVPAGEKLLVPMTGAYAQRIDRLAREAGRVVVAMPVPRGTSVDPAAVAAALAADPTIRTLGVVYSETGSGVIHDVPAIGRAAHRAGVRTIVDAVSAFGALPFDIAAQPETDAVVFTSNKCLEGGTRHAFQALVAGEQHGIGFRLRRDVERQRAESGNGIDDHAHAGAVRRRADRGHVVDHTAAGLAVDDAQMSDRRVRRQRRRHRLRRGAGAARHRQLHDDAPGLGRQPIHPIRIGAGHRQQHLFALGDEGADCRLGDKMPAALQRQRDMLARHAAGDCQHALPQAGENRLEVIVPGREVMRQRGLHLGRGCDGTGSEQQHGNT
jgi:hypothetical protein